MAKTKTIRVSEDELAALKAFREAQGNTVYSEPTEDEVKSVQITESQQAMADAFVSAIERTRGPVKQTVATRKPNTPWAPAGVPRTKLKRKMYHHGLLLDEKITNEDIELLNKIRPGHYCDGYVRVTLRKDRGLDIDYPVRTASQRLKLINQFGVRSFTELLQRIIDEKANGAKYRKAEDSDLYDFSDQ